MSIRINYIIMPIDYVRELNNKGNRKKASAFMEYFNDMDMDDINAIRFYAKSWEVSHTTVMRWVDEFKHEIERFFSLWQLKNSAYNSSIKKTMFHQCDTDVPKDIEQTTEKSSFKKNSVPPVFHECSKVFNINNNKQKRFDKNFEDMYGKCRFSNKYTGNKEQAYEEYMLNHQHISHIDMAYAYMIHSNDPQTNGKTYNLTNFMKNQAYLNYLKPKIEIKKGEKLIVGYYDQSLGTVITDENIQYTITKEKFASMVASGEITITSSMKVA